MTYHSKSKRKPKGSTRGAQTSPRISVSLPAEDMALLTWWSGVKGIPAADVLRAAVASYFLPFRNNPALKKQYGSAP